jgi:hypothetical protein
MSIGVIQPITQARFQGASRPGAKHGCSRAQTHRAHELLPTTPPMSASMPCPHTDD